MFAQDGLNQIEQWRKQSVTRGHQLDWRWVERYRELCAYDNIWWLTWTGPFTEVEQAQWDHLSSLPLDETSKIQLGILMKVSRERDLTAALAQQREPHRKSCGEPCKVSLGHRRDLLSTEQRLAIILISNKLNLRPAHKRLSCDLTY